MIISRYFLIALAVLLLTPFRSADAACEPFPKVSLWGNYTHERVKNYVAAKLEGDWDTYVGHLQKRLKSLKAIEARGDVLKLKYRGKRVVLKDRKLAAYVQAAERRVAVARCLAADADVDSLENFATAAGGNMVKPQAPVVTKTSTVSTKALKMSVVSECRAGVATFKVTNNAGAWPKAGTIGIYRTDELNPKPISKRRIRFAKGQTSTFRVKSLKGGAGDLALWVSPGWAQRTYTEDATLSCG